ncbi:MAG: FtsX-like permease family protein [Gammaproteobacteria bacterium]|nr:FtsX-like permease family protein [Gammaproteobacteria bacterium]MDE0273347.1 FtsX-like permease family protein [Gammaproteobacteria bacterium]
MAEISADIPVSRGSAGLPASVLAIAWRNLWRNPRRTWLMSGSIAFAIWMLAFSFALQKGAFDVMTDNGARLWIGHAQIQHPDFEDEPLLENVIADAPRLRRSVEALDGVVTAAPRAEAAALVSAGERSFGALVVGVEAAAEAQWSGLAGAVAAGRYLDGAGQAFVGDAMARNLGISVGDELVMLGTAKEGGVAAAVAEVTGVFSTGSAALDRSLALIPIADFRAAWNLAPDEAHRLVVVVDDVGDALDTAQAAAGAAAPFRVLDWQALMPEVKQFIDLKLAGLYFLFAIIAIIITFSVVNAFLMTLFERTAEFGMLKAIGMRPGSILGQLQFEALLLWALGVVLGVGVTLGLVLWLGAAGMPMPIDPNEVMPGLNMPDRIYPSIGWGVASVACLTLLAGTQLALLVPAVRLRRLNCVEALRTQE